MITISSVSRINELQNSTAFTLYPSPTSGILNISIKDPHFIPSSLMVYDITGRKLLNEKINFNTSLTAINVSGLDNGAYILVLTDDHTQQIARFTISR
ncbi:MAG TPA: T9SS type A sorting domain-containing protein [Bacteroidia bacterium]|nr:T9SS type A sorting domain-containing protein [Bacteroidia bacterium]